jgi:hypothetical protein
MVPVVVAYSGIGWVSLCAIENGILLYFFRIGNNNHEFFKRCFSVEDKNAQLLHHCFEIEKNVVFLTPKLSQKVRNLSLNKLL